ncbi:Uncharacterized protein PODLI_1B010239, partial [Podarcis lilfordi]
MAAHGGWPRPQAPRGLRPPQSLLAADNSETVGPSRLRIIPPRVMGLISTNAIYSLALIRNVYNAEAVHFQQQGHTSRSLAEEEEIPCKKREKLTAMDACQPCPRLLSAPR